MENRGSDLARGASGSQESGEASAARARKWEQKIRAPSPASEGQEAAGTGEKKRKTQSTAPSEDLFMIARDDTEHSSSNIVPGQEQGSEQIEGLEWDKDKLKKEVACCLTLLGNRAAADDDWEEDEDESWARDEGQMTELNRRLDLYYMKAHEPKYRKMDDSEPAEYYDHNCHNSEWYFDDEYCSYANLHLQDYQRLVLTDHGQYEDWDDYRKLHNTLEADQQFVQLWEMLSSETKLIGLFLKDELPNIETLLFYHALKIAEGLPLLRLSLVDKAYTEFIWSMRFKHTWSKYYAGFFFNMWQLVIKEKMDFKDAMLHIQNEGKYDERILPIEFPLGANCKPYLDRIGETAEEGEAYETIMTFADQFVMRCMTYYDYAKKKLGIAKEIGLIPPAPTKALCDTAVQELYSNEG